MNILVTGSHGLVGSALVPFLTTGGHRVIRLVRGAPPQGGSDVRWDPARGMLDAAALEGVDAVVHLAGESIAGRWTKAKKDRIRESRVHATRALCEALARIKRLPRVVVSASGVGYYGDRGEEVLTEESSAGEGFLAEVCRAWEGATEAIDRCGVRVVRLRFGMVLSAAGGALPHMVRPFRVGAGGVLGDGRQYMSWVALDDAIGAIHHALHTTELEGPVNVVAPAAVTNSEFTKVLGKVLRRPTRLSMPASAVRLLLGEMADQLLLASTRVRPSRLQESGYMFGYPELEDGLRHQLGLQRAGA